MFSARAESPMANTTAASGTPSNMISTLALCTDFDGALTSWLWMNRDLWITCDRRRHKCGGQTFVAR
jgi:hypothetical protein